MDIEKLKQQSPVDRFVWIALIFGLPFVFLIPIRWYFCLVIWLILASGFCTFYLWKWGYFEHIKLLIDIIKTKKRLKEENKQ